MSRDRIGTALHAFSGPTTLSYPVERVEALKYAPQLMTDAMTIEMPGGLVVAQFIHFTVGGGMVEVAAA